MAVLQQFRYKRSETEVTTNTTEPEEPEINTTMAPTIAATVKNTVTPVPASEDDALAVTHLNTEQKFITEIAEQTHRKCFHILINFMR